MLRRRKSAEHNFLFYLLMKKLLLILLVCLSYTLADAGVRSAFEMQKIAFSQLKSFRQTPSANSRLLSANQIICVDDAKAYSVYEVHDMGFVIVGKDTRLPEVLGYSKTAYDADNMPDGLKYWLSQVSEACAKGTPLTVRKRQVEPIEPFVTTRWGQEEPYNLLAPKLGSRSTPTGCVATAMAQAINYMQYPESAAFTGKYYLGENDETGNSGTVNSTYTYPLKMAYGQYVDADGVTQTMEYTNEEANAVATLMRDCGYAVEMQYTTSGSGAFMGDAGAALISKFKYPATNIKTYYRDYYAEDEWFDIVHTELANKNPVLYGGSDKQFGGHAFVFAGMDETGKVYVNWGWDGSQDGFYDILLLNPQLYYFTTGNDMVTGIRKTKELDCDKNIYQFLTDAPYTFKFLDKKNMSLTLNGSLYNAGVYSSRFNLDIVAENTETQEAVSIANIVERVSIQTFYGFQAGTDTTEYEQLAPGQYKLYIGVKRNSDSKWTLVRTIGGEVWYNISVASDGTVTLDETPVYTGITAPKVYTGVSKAAGRFKGTYDLQGRSVNSDYRGVMIKDGRKVLKR